jgi:hypothetical protein
MCRSASADRRRAALALFAGASALAGCAKVEPVAALQAPQPRFQVERFFSGRTAGEATLKIIWRDPVAVRVQGEGQVLADGTLVLNQLVERAGKAPQRRQWRIRPAGAPGRYSGYLSDATDLVRGAVEGNQLRLRYSMKDGLTVTQYLYLQPDGRSARNVMTITKLGVKVARLDETIRKLD